jgi:two-component system, chemotaxis family, sensor kinase CheA
MKLWFKGLLAYADRHLPADALLDEGLRRRGRAGQAFAAVFLTQVPTFTLVFWIVDLNAAALIVVAAGVALGVAPQLMKRSVVVGNRYVVVVTALVLYGVGFYSGGPRAPAMYWTAAVPVMAMMAATVAEGVFWAVCTASMAGLLVGAEKLGVPFPPRVTLWQVQFFDAMSIAMLVFVMFGLAFSYELTRKSMVQALDQVNGDMRLVLDNVDQGFVTVTRGGVMTGMRSLITHQWFGVPLAEETLADWLSRADANTGGWLRMGLEEVFDGALPIEVSLDQMPKRFSVDARTYDLAYRPILAAPEQLRALVVIISDATERMQTEQAEASQRELITLFAHLARDRAGVLQFLEEAAQIVARLSEPEPHALRLVHTLKGNAGIFGLKGLAKVCHIVESNAQDEQREPAADELRSIRTAWAELGVRIAPLIAEHEDHLSVDEADLARLESAIRTDEPSEHLLAMVATLRHERADKIFARFAEQAEALASRLGRCKVESRVVHSDERFARSAWAPVWSAMVHAVRNAVDHGGQTPDERRDAAKPEAMQLTFECVRDASALRIRVSDDGAGINWERVRERARTRGLPHETAEHLHEALFADGLSTREVASELSGRGVGLGALRGACAALGGQVAIRSRTGRGTTLEIVVPTQHLSLRATG